MSVRARWSEAPDVAPAEGDPFASIPAERGGLPSSGTLPNSGSSNGVPPGANSERTFTESELWQRRDDTSHPTPVGYWLESEFTLDTPIEGLEARLRELVEREANCDQLGITCPIKDLPGVSCSACPISEVGQHTRKALLCRIGREQERVSALIEAKRHADS